MGFGGIKKDNIDISFNYIDSKVGQQAKKKYLCSDLLKPLKP